MFISTAVATRHHKETVRFAGKSAFRQLHLCRRSESMQQWTVQTILLLIYTGLQNLTLREKERPPSHSWILSCFTLTYKSFLQLRCDSRGFNKRVISALLPTLYSHVIVSYMLHKKAFQSNVN